MSLSQTVNLKVGAEIFRLNSLGKKQFFWKQTIYYFNSIQTKIMFVKDQCLEGMHNYILGTAVSGIME